MQHLELLLVCRGVDQGDLGIARDQSPRPVQEAEDPLHSVRVPRLHLLERTHEHEVEAQCVGARGADDVVGVNDVAFALGHLHGPGDHPHLGVSNEDEIVGLLHHLCLHNLVSDERDLGLLLHRTLQPFAYLLRAHHAARFVLEDGVLDRPEDEALVDQLLEGLLRVHHPGVVEHLVPEASVQKVKDRVLGPAEVQVHWHPVLFDRRVDRRPDVVRVQEPQVVPAGSSPLGHGVGLAPNLAAIRQLIVHPIGGGRQRPLRSPRRLVTLHIRQLHGKVLIRHGNSSPVLEKGDREGLPPVALAREEPVAQPEVHLAVADAVGLEERDRHGLRLQHRLPVQVHLRVCRVD
mmetsp:Transcript_26498/g.63294  ORF Transcript_26498/g.63294 Transcript_26498/m.63294 type:complete len:348 (+) Transcript_26498:488-1531(+)